MDFRVSFLLSLRNPEAETKARLKKHTALRAYIRAPARPQAQFPGVRLGRTTAPKAQARPSSYARAAGRKPHTTVLRNEGARVCSRSFMGERAHVVLSGTTRARCRRQLRFGSFVRNELSLRRTRSSYLSARRASYEYGCSFLRSQDIKLKVVNNSRNINNTKNTNSRK